MKKHKDSVFYLSLYKHYTPKLYRLVILKLSDEIVYELITKSKVFVRKRPGKHTLKELKYSVHDNNTSQFKYRKTDKEYEEL